ncbi:MAG: YybS family protein, partial [Coriobacteriia bacterium]|nr:YybS family protein [Coriobacteriia bacterium]
SQIELARTMLVTLWPGLYFQTALLGAVLVVTAASWGARRAGVELRVPRMRDLDLSVHVLWGLLAGLVLLAAAQVLGGRAATMQAIGLNLLFCTRALFFLQGLGVFSAIFDVPKSGRVKMLALYLALWVIDQVLLVVSFVGLADFWANFRRLPRDGATVAGLPEGRSTES